MVLFVVGRIGGRWNESMLPIWAQVENPAVAANDRVAVDAVIDAVEQLLLNHRHSRSLLTAM